VAASGKDDPSSGEEGTQGLAEKSPTLKKICLSKSGS
jgi:hypothetical protein